MADLRASGLGGVPKGTTADRPSPANVGDVFYNGTLGCLEIYTSQGWVANSAPPGIPDIGITTYSGTNQPYNNATVSVVFTPGQGGGLPNSYRAISTPGGYSGTGTSSPVTITGLQSGTAYTFAVTGTNNFGTSASSINSNSITATTVPQAPTIGTLSYVSNTSLSLTFTANATGGSAITNYKYSTDGTNYTAFSPAQTSSPLTISGLTPSTNYAFYIKAVNANGDSIASSISNTVFTGVSVSGGTLSSDSTYYYRTFTNNGTLSVSNGSLTMECLVIGGGGAGGYTTNGWSGGGGGSGGAVYHSGLSFSSGNYSATVGAGAAGPTANVAGNRAPNGVNSSLTTSGSTMIAYGGGGGAGYFDAYVTGASGGSGGGGEHTAGTSSATQGTGGTAAYGNAGGAGNQSSNSGGGGGLGSVGQTSSPGNGGSGLNTWSAWATATSTGVSGFYGGGGGGGSYSSTGGAGGSGGGGAGGNNTGSSGQSGTANTGGGGGGRGNYQAGSGIGGSGGSGIIIVRYTKSQVGG